MDVPTIYGEWREENPTMIPQFEHYVRVVSPDGTSTLKAVDRYIRTGAGTGYVFERLERECLRIYAGRLMGSHGDQSTRAYQK